MTVTALKANTNKLCGGDATGKGLKTQRNIARSTHSTGHTRFYHNFYFTRLKDYLGNTFAEWKYFGLLKKGTAQKLQSI